MSDVQILAIVLVSLFLLVVAARLAAEELRK